MFIFFPCICLFIGKTILPSLNCLSAFNRNQLTMDLGVCFWILCLFY